ncbi:threonine ammonia-lyase IlvA [Oricola thermophila]|uniref:L-threonine dehydratase n=1 Tax=Oricola thermophila TaxID=2742145 RepID=A0A6N1VDM4_9HYPH|nr:threonine ammonia-lyase IlvA [Oricola thermophila]QKV17715.1 threonine ammonia-lyase IlvA [Oricola thermophila]
MSDFPDAVAEATAAMRGLFPETPLQENVFLGRKYGMRVFLKREDLSPVRSYKIRGAFNFIRKRLAEGAEGPFVCASAGNHAQGLAYVCRHFDRQGVIFMPVTTPQQKIDKTRAFGGDNVEIRLIGDYFDDCNRAALDYAEAEGAVMVPPFDDEDIIEGQASVALEALEQAPAGVQFDRVIAAVGGGGLASGLTRYFSAKGEAAAFTLVEPAGAPSLRQSLEKGERVRLQGFDNFVDGAAVGQIGEKTWEVLRRYAPGDVDLVAEDRLCTTMIEMLNVEGVVLEPAGALAIDALKDIAPRERDGKTVLCIVSGGNFDFERLAEVKERALRSEGLKKYFVLRMPQRPGALKDFLTLLGPDDDITRFEYLKKSARNFGSVLIGIETKDPANFAGLMARMNDKGLAWQDLTDNELVGGLLV